jgi:adenosylcobinamide-GDP ribazoletransferase
MAISGWNVSVMFRGVLMTLFSLGVTGGLHMDGFMDTCDAVFSRQDRKARLEILTDTHTGAFAVMGCVSLLLLRAGIFSELLPRFHQRSHTGIPLLLALIPFYSRAGLGILFYLPFARKEGLVRTLGEARVPRDRFVLVAGYAAASAVPMLRLGLRGEMVPLAAAAFFLLYRPYCLKTFGGICGDLMGAFVELSETLMLLTLVAGGL